MKSTIRWLIGGITVLCVLGTWFLYPHRVEGEAQGGKEIQVTTADDEFSHELFDQVLQKYVDSQGRVNYAGLKSDPGTLESYLNLLAVNAPSDKATFQTGLAFWINAYNALTIKGVLDHYPTTSVRKIKLFGGFFSSIKFQVGGRSYTLDNIEHDIIRYEFGDPRIHFALVCASLGCPILENRAFVPETLEERLDNVAANFINNPEKVRLDRENGVLYLSQIFEWYAEDFEDTHNGVIDFIAEYLPETDAAFLKREKVQLQYLQYDWSLNAQSRAEKQK